jgi:L-ectoine synthase
MIVRSIEEVKTVEWGNGLSRRFLTAADGMGYTLTDTIVNAGTKSRLEYRNHLEACYCVDGEGEVIDMAGNSHRITPGVMYALDQHDAHYLIAAPHTDLRLICMFTPALRGDEAHSLDAARSSAY